MTTPTHSKTKHKTKNQNKTKQAHKLNQTQPKQGLMGKIVSCGHGQHWNEKHCMAERSKENDRVHLLGVGGCGLRNYAANYAACAA